MTLFDDKLHEAPIGEHPQRIIDVGTGTGIWAIEMGKSATSIPQLKVPPNVKFEIDDVELEWTHNEPFDYIHCRYMCACIKNWPKLVRTCYEHLKPGGYVEFKDFDLQYYSEDNTYTDDLACARYISLILQGANMTGKDPCPGRNLEKWVRDAGFEDVHHKLVKVPLGPWPADSKLKTVGLLSRTQRLEGLEAFALAFLTRQLHWEVEEVQILVAKSQSSYVQFGGQD
ncbi:MAG: hypothetical protein M1819_001943 [Sarea resinae]|nr:MAG: hypothetical protein M1819_001943 [Sarea resinae]